MFRLKRIERNPGRHFISAVLWLGLLVIANASANASPYQDPRLLSWSEQYRAGKSEAVLRAVEQDLLSTTPHPYAAHIWSTIQLRRNQLEQAMESLPNEKLRAALGPMPVVMQLYDDGQYHDLLARFPVEQAKEITDVWVLNSLALAAGSLNYVSAKYAYAFAQLQLDPSSFQPVWLLEDVLKSDALRAGAAERLLEPGLDGTPAAAYLSDFLATRPWQDLDQLAALETWLVHVPSDSRALRAKGVALDSQRHDEQAAQAHLQSYELYPFYSDASGAAESMLVARRYEDAKRLLTQASRVYGTGEDDHQRWFARTLANAMRGAGDKGGAREVLSEALDQWPNDTELLLEQARLEMADERYQEAVEFALQAVGDKPAKPAHEALLMKALQLSGGAGMALERFEAYTQGPAAITPAIYARGSAMLAALDKTDERVTLLERALADYPESTWMRGEAIEAYEKAGDAAQALAVLQQALELNPEYGWAATRLQEYAEMAEGTDDAAVVEAWVERHPWSEDLWKELVDLKGNTPDAKLSLWQSAAQKNPNALFPTKNQVSILLEEKRWDEAEKVISAYIDRPSGVGAADATNRFFWRGYLQAKRSTHEQLDSAVLERAVADLDRYKDGHGWLLSYYEWSAQLLRALGKRQAAAHMYLQYARTDADDTGVFHTLVAEYADELGLGKTFGHGAEIVRRNPYDGEKIERVIHKHVMWGGSPIIALQLIAHVKEHALLSEDDYRSYEGNALGKLGDKIARYEAMYQRSTAISQSDRYIDWYDSTRKSVMQGSNRSVRLISDAENPTAEITLPNGEVLLRVDHPISGRVISVSKGPAYFRAEYDATGSRLERIVSSSGSEIELGYDDADQVNLIRTSDGQELLIRNNEAGKPVLLQVVGIGELRVTYDADNEVERVEGIGTDGEPGNMEVIGKIPQIMDRLLTQVRLFQAVQGDDIPDLPFIDEERDRLRDAYQELRWSEEASSTQAALALARFLVTNLADDIDYAAEARGLLVEVFEAGAQAQDEQAGAAAAEAVFLWHRLALATKPKGLPGEEFTTWSVMRDWLRDKAIGSAKEAYQNWFARVDDQPLALFPDALWLPDSDLRNTGFWHRHANTDLLPGGSGQARPTALLERMNGDLVVGSTVGLSVMRNGFWEWFGFDDTLGRFSLAVDPGSVSAASEILSLTETEDGVLWVGSAKGLYALNADYDGEAARWQSAGEGLPSPRVEHLLAHGEGVLLGTPAGMRVATLDGVAPAPQGFAAQAIRWLSLIPEDSDALGSRMMELLEQEPDLHLDTHAALREAWFRYETYSESAHDFLTILQASLQAEEERAQKYQVLTQSLTSMQGKALCEADEDLVDEFYYATDEDEMGLNEAESTRFGELYYSTEDPQVFLQGTRDLFASAQDQSEAFRAVREVQLDVLDHRFAQALAQREAGCVDAAVVEDLVSQAGEFLTRGQQEEYEFALEYEEVDSLRLIVLELLSVYPEAAARVREQAQVYLRDIRRLLHTGQPLLVGTQDGLHLIDGEGGETTIFASAVDSVAWYEKEGRLIVQQGTDLHSVSFDEQGQALAPVPLPGQQDLRFSKQIFGVARVRTPDGEEAVAALTDLGVSFYRDWHFESMALPLEYLRNGLQIGPRAIATRDTRMALATHEAVYDFAHDRALIAQGDAVYDLVTDDELGVTYVATGHSIRLIDHDEVSAGDREFSSVSAKHLALDQEGRLIANDGFTIVRFDRGETYPQELFSAYPEHDQQWGDGPVRHLMAAADGTIWVASGGSVFRWKEGVTEEAEEFSYFVDADRFPSRTHMISYVAETVDGKIQVQASDEGHLSYRGVRLEGGTLEYAPDTGSFSNLGEVTGGLITGYTRIDNETAIAGSTFGFYLHKSGSEPELLGSSAYPSYQRLKQDVPMLWLGRAGAQIDEQSWLFPAAGGVILYHQGRWLYPERLNQMLPRDQKLGQYGGRTVHAVSVDKHGRVYAGTDVGLLIFETGGSVASLLIDSGMGEEAFSDVAITQLQQLKEVMLAGVAADSEQGRLLSRFQALEEEIQGLKLAQQSGVLTTAANPSSAEASGQTAASGVDKDKLKARLKEREKARQRLLHRLENEHYGLFQMLKLDPRELAALHKELAAGQAVVQYLPTPKTLYIQVVTREGAHIREVDIGSDALFAVSRRAASHLAHDAFTLAGVKQNRGFAADIQAQSLPPLEEDLAWLYAQLLRPIERDLTKMTHVFVVPVGPLTYLPFPALLRSTDHGPEYAVERFAMGTLPSLFHLGLVLRQRASYMDESLLLGDPDGSLPAAREEVREVQGALSTAREPLIGTQATYEAFTEQAEESRVIHLATHGKLNHERPEESYLLLADGYRLSVLDISMLDLEETDLVVLSACESGIGREGLEYATLARAFAHANVPSVIASLWQVNDPATRALMVGFYEHYNEGTDVFTAMARAQRAMIRGDEAWRTPAAWSGFLVFGKP